MTTSANDNSEQIAYWNEQAGPTWVDAQERMDAMLAPLTEVALTAANVQPGERVIDVGCGCGDTSLQMAQAGASVWGIDISAPMLARARERASADLAGELRFSEADAASANLTPDHHLVFSRFGVMFFSDPVGAFANLRSGLNGTGRLSFICWQKPRDNPWMSTAGAAIQHHLPEPDTPPDPRAPGPFAFADRDYLHDILSRAGYAGITIEGITRNMHLADTLDEAMAAQSEIGPLSRALKELDGATRDAALADARRALEAHMTPDGLDLDAAIWLVQANVGV